MPLLWFRDSRCEISGVLKRADMFANLIFLYYSADLVNRALGDQRPDRFNKTLDRGWGLVLMRKYPMWQP